MQELIQQLIALIEHTGSIRVAQFSIALNEQMPKMDVKYTLNTELLEMQLEELVSSAVFVRVQDESVCLN